MINEVSDPSGYVKTWDQFRFAEGVFDMLRALSSKGYRLVVVTNQQGVGKGLMDDVAVRTIHRNMCTEVRRQGAVIEAVYFCPHLEQDNCDCRKPKPGLIRQAIDPLAVAVNLSASWMIGDSARDIEAGAAAGLKTLLVSARVPDGMQVTPTAVAADVGQVADVL